MQLRSKYDSFTLVRCGFISRSYSTDSSVGKVLADGNPIESYNVKESDQIICMVSPVQLSTSNNVRLDAYTKVTA